MIDNLRKFGWLVPFKFLRHLIVKYWFRTRESGTFQLTCVPTVDVVAPYIFSSSAIFGVGQVKERQNTETIDRRLSVNVTLVVNHAIFDGQRASILLNEFKNILEKIESYYQQT